MSRLKAEQSIVQEQMTRDRVTVERLETLLDQARQESMNAQATNQELQNEISRLKQKVSELQNKLYASHYITLFYYLYITLRSLRFFYRSSESAELRQYQNQAAEYSKQISELRRQVTNERFDRARKEEQSRRYFIAIAKNAHVYLFSSSVHLISRVLSIFIRILSIVIVSKFRDFKESTILCRQKPFHDRAILPQSNVRPSSGESAAATFR